MIGTAQAVEGRIAFTHPTHGKLIPVGAPITVVVTPWLQKMHDQGDIVLTLGNPHEIVETPVDDTPPPPPDETPKSKRTRSSD